MAKRKISATQKLRKLVSQQLRRMEKRGYRVDSELKEKIRTGKYQTLKSLQRNKYEKLYKGATAETDGKIVTGQQKRIIERKESAQKAAKTKKIRKNLRDIGFSDRDIQDYERYKKKENENDDYIWEEARRRQDEIDRERARLYQEGEIVYDQIQQLIDEYPTKGSTILKNELSRQIAKYGKDKTMQALGMAPDKAIAEAQTIIFYENGTDDIHASLVSFFDIITGTVPTSDEAKQLGETMDSMTDMGSM